MVTDLERDLADTEEELRTARRTSARDAASVTHVAHLHVRRAALTGRPRDHAVAVRAVGEARDAVGPWPDLCLLEADLQVREHRVADARRTLQAVPTLLDCTRGRALLADVALQQGRFREAEDVVRDLVARERTWDHLARLANLLACRGHLGRADSLYADAEEEITAKSMRAYAWVELERSRLWLDAGDPPRARRHLDTAARAYTGHWLAHEQRGRLLAAEGKVAEAVAEHWVVLERTGRPEAHEALAELYERSGDPVPARRHRHAALVAFEASARAGETRYLHHLAETLGRLPVSAGGPERAVAWARRDLAARPNHLTRATLAWTLHRAGREREATAEMVRALGTGLRDPRLLARAREVFGSPDEATWPVPDAVAAVVAGG